MQRVRAQPRAAAADAGVCAPGPRVRQGERRAGPHLLSIDSTTNANVGGINSWQPIGVAAQANDKLQVFVGGRANAGSDPITAGPSPLVLGIGQNGGETKDVYTTIASSTTA